MKCIFITGIAGSGKTTVSEYISEAYNIPRISVGALLRKEALFNNEIKKIIENGDPVSAETINTITKKEMKKMKGDIFLRDGKILSEEQLEGMNILTQENNLENIIIYLDISKQHALHRMKSRGRNDDISELFEKRLNRDIETLLLTKKMINIRDTYHVDAEQDLEKVKADIEKLLAEII